MRLNAILRETEKRLKKAPEGQVRIVKHGNGYQFYLRTESTNTNGIYLPVSERKMANALVQKSYDLKIAREAEKQRAIIDRFIKGYDPDVIKRIYESLADTRKEIVKPFEISDQEYIKKWMSFEYPRKGFPEGTAEHYTSKGERVRSKSEVMIADALSNAGIPYRYECPLDLGNLIVHPDFTILRIEDRKQIYWEHLGMMDCLDYCQDAVQKIRLYESSGIYPGIDLIITMETARLPINLAIINNMIKTYCL